MILQGGKLYYDTPVGILCLDSQFPKPRGHLRNPLTYPFPTVQYLIRGVDVPRMLFNPTPELIEPFLEGARELERQGVLAIAGSCGFMARFQQRIAAEVRVPVLLSSLVQLPLLRLLHGEGARIGVLTASATSLTQDHFGNCMTDMRSISIQGMEHNPEFAETILQSKRTSLDLDRLQKEVVDTATAFVSKQKLDALLLECTDLSAFAAPVQRAVGIPVYDINTLVTYAASAVVRHDYL